MLLLLEGGNYELFREDYFKMTKTSRVLKVGLQAATFVTAKFITITLEHIASLYL
jgi:hypothetical protein